MAALVFSFDTLKTGGHFLCKFYQGTEEKAFENKLKRLFAKVSREKLYAGRGIHAGSRLTVSRNPKRRTLWAYGERRRRRKRRFSTSKVCWDWDL
jgi:21S rRNA (uridine2791-2'-O)-methyltransferase